MTADEARVLTEEARNPGNDKTKLVLDLWHKAIEKAAGVGRNFVRESDLPRLRTPIPAISYWAARERLKESGFKVEDVQDGPSESTFEVSW